MSKKSSDHRFADLHGERGEAAGNAERQVRPASGDTNVDGGGEAMHEGRNSGRESAETRRTEREQR